MKRRKTISTLMDLKIIKCMFFGKDHIDIYRDKWGKFYIRLNGRIIKKKLGAEATIIWLGEYVEYRT